jgi:hypothetical protein
MSPDLTPAIIGLIIFISSLISLRFGLSGAILQDATTSFVAWNTAATDIISPCLKLGGSVAPQVPFAHGKLTLARNGDVRDESLQTSSQYSLGRTSLDMFREMRLDCAFMADDDLGNSTWITGSIGFKNVRCKEKRTASGS